MKNSNFRRILFLVALLAPALFAGSNALAQSPTSYFYYYGRTKIALPLDPAHVAVRFRANLPADRPRAITGSTPRLGSYDRRQDVALSRLTILPVASGSAPLDAVRDLNANADVEFSAPVFQFPAGDRVVPTDEVIVRYRPDASASARAALNARLGAQFARTRGGDSRVEIYRVNPKVTDALIAANAFVDSGLVEYAEPDFLIEKPVLRAPANEPTRSPLQPRQSTATDATYPNDLYFASQWALYNWGQFVGSQVGADIRAPAAWAMGQGSPNVVIAVIDEGVDTTDPDIAGKVSSMTSTMPAPYNNPAPQAGNRHGTEVAGTAAANTNNGLGIAGACWYCRIMSVKVAYEDSNGYWVTQTSYLAAGIAYAWQNGADVINNSWTLSSPSFDIQSAITDAYTNGRCQNAPCGYGDPTARGSTVIAATGNENTGAISFPASLNAYVISVGASNWCDQWKDNSNTACNFNEYWWGSNYGTGLDLVAPGIEIHTTQSATPYNYYDGTSAAAPLVSGTAALLYSLEPNLIPDQVRTALRVGADDIGAPGYDAYTGYGRLNMARTLEWVDLAISTSDGGVGVASVGQTLTFTQVYTNTGATGINPVNITVTLPPRYQYVSSSPTYTSTGGGVYTLATSLGSGASASSTITVRVIDGTAGPLQTVTAQISNLVADPTPADDLAQDTNRVPVPSIMPYILRGGP